MISIICGLDYITAEVLLQFMKLCQPTSRNDSSQNCANEIARNITSELGLPDTTWLFWAYLLTDICQSRIELTKRLFELGHE